jgi:hypothetical protein
VENIDAGISAPLSLVRAGELQSVVTERFKLQEIYLLYERLVFNTGSPGVLPTLDAGDKS